MNDEELRRWATAPMRTDPVRADRLDHELRVAREYLVELAAAGQYLADVLRAGSGSTYTAGCMGALERWELARTAALTAGADRG